MIAVADWEAKWRLIEPGLSNPPPIGDDRLQRKNQGTVVPDRVFEKHTALRGRARLLVHERFGDPQRAAN